jgi:cellulose synthase/poly-beta-1,6-N-acetylglucosamine synthase-like glycosyltransferase
MSIAALTLCALTLAIYFACLARFALTPLLNFFLRHRVIPPMPPMPPGEQWPRTSVHLAVYREHRVLRDLIQSILDLDYPADKLSVLVLDDSTGDDAARTRAVVETFADTGRVHYANRGSRTGFKAGALNHGLTLFDGELVAYFDADCKPLRGFLRNTIPYFSDPNVAAVQARFDYGNTDSPLTQLQAAIFEWLFRFEITVRAKLGHSSFYMGTAAVWRKSAIEAAGGWQEQPFTAEDLDLAYRVTALGWRVAYQPEHLARTTAVEDLLAFRAQQRRWARSMLQVAADNRRGMWKSRGGVAGRLYELTVGLAHGSGPAFLLAILGSMAAIMAGVERTTFWKAMQWAFSASLLLSPVMTTLALAQRFYHPADWTARVRRLYASVPEFLSLVTCFVFGLSDYLRATRAEFVVTPKGGEVAVMRGSRRTWLMSHTLPAVFQAVVGLAACVTAGMAALRYPEAVLPQALAGVALLVSCVRTALRIHGHAQELRGRTAAATFG